MPALVGLPCRTKVTLRRGIELRAIPYSHAACDPRPGRQVCALWNLFDLTPEGRGTDWYPEL
jgi:predicted dithiol-disulfide oxidoreductase (DUF899 family)